MPRLSEPAAAAAADTIPPSWHEGFEGQHELLADFSCIDTACGKRIVPNSEPFPLDNECFSGHVMLMIRTPDVDDPKKSPLPSDSPEMAKSISKYMKGRLRRFEFQFRVKLKKVPTGPLFLGCDVEETIKIGRLTKGLTSVLLAMIRRINSGFHYSWGADKGAKKNPVSAEDYEAGNFERTHLSFPLEASMDRIVITKPGEELPKLGGELMETPESIKRRRRMGAGVIDWNTEDTYTMCLWSAYMDWIKWKSMNVAGVRPFSMGIVTGTQPIYLSVYEVKGISNEDYKRTQPPHFESSKNVFTRLEFAHLHKTVGGYAQKLMDAREVALETDTEFDSESELFDRGILSERSSTHSSIGSVDGTVDGEEEDKAANGDDEPAVIEPEKTSVDEPETPSVDEPETPPVVEPTTSTELAEK
eukprot:CAMPEP_0194038504 /NCGR_PEP_ID=MMETSP0009_2-20130614/10738_1 /TAXON_ID=210454 /ORGANISM="Grammatophora oceanica, Strain CCMP 410" /LENGTH=416 /DNA_ID=CAMNT_0038681023 /DNA_START=162 /DNA_END=1412 /DNA_ORIENTATION=+